MVHSNHQLDVKHTNVDRIKEISAIRVLGFSTVNIIAGASNGADNALIISPHFKTEDAQRGSSEDNFWDKSTNSTAISSFGGLDMLITFILHSKNLPNINKIFITSHSAGGQFAQRYALTAYITFHLPYYGEVVKGFALCEIMLI